ncbi:hypothetical protein E2C01_025963 [Portunus trituberculatus]|uniref:Secreted protein n=1 Tax=Portunus trituberculatus TaxID=210409 RepID=A0A5B7EEL0_PORTR|nr:hypothetical protein [Portunus trituberculatus]
MLLLDKFTAVIFLFTVGSGWPSPDRQHREGQGRHKQTPTNLTNQLDGNQNSLNVLAVEVLWFLPRETDGIKDTVVREEGLGQDYSAT